ncbi:MAG: cysteine desulfurase [Candidatus Zambryskibacteria bacterium]|nr:cysteine desulfurase [Candidatus Zambryskibacteria bacterium]
MPHYTLNYDIIQDAVIKKRKEKRIFLDYASITPLDKEVKKEMDKVQEKFWGNPSSLHTEGEKANHKLEESRIKIARILHCRANEIFFTSGGTEAINLAILGVIKASKERLPHIICSTIEHPAVLELIKNLINEKKTEVSFISPDGRGIINPKSVKKEIKENTILIIIQHANNEIGTIQPIREIVKIIRNSNFATRNSYPYFLVDACQSALYEDISIERLGADLLILDGVKMYGPRGAGILISKHNLRISPVIFGGGQERGLRSGTENVANAAGLAKALELAVGKREKEIKRLTKLRDWTIKKMLNKIPNSSLNGDSKKRLPNNINICLSQGDTLGKFPKVSPWDSEFLVIKLDTLGFAVSSASACHALSNKSDSYVIEALNPKCANSSLRITFGRDTKKSDLDKFISVLKKVIK